MDKKVAANQIVSLNFYVRPLIIYVGTKMSFEC